MNPNGFAGMKKGAPSINPSGRPKDSPELKKGKDALKKLCPKAVATLAELLDCDDNKVRATVGLGILKATIGDLERHADEEGKSLNPYEGWTKAEILELVRSGR